jgi:hypothetical protein
MKRMAFVIMATSMLVASARGASTSSISIPAVQPWTDTGVTLTAGQQVAITASGTIYVGALSNSALDNETPNGQPWGGPNCPMGVPPYNTPGLACWSLVGRIGTGAAFEVGNSLTFTAASSGELYLGVNDNNFPDNSGSWAVTITVSSANTVSLETPCVNGLQVDINGSASSGASVSSISWNWGDGTATNGFFPQSHTYATTGTYRVQVTANYNDGSTAASSQTVSVASGALSNCVALTITAGQYGSVNYQASVGSGIVPPGSYTILQLDFADDLTLTASPDLAFSFSRWSPSAGITGIGGTPVSTTLPSTQIVVGAASSITGNFALSLAIPPTPTTTPSLGSFPSTPELFDNQASSFFPTFESQTSSDAQDWLTSSSIVTNVSTTNNFLGLSFGSGYKETFGEIASGANVVSTGLGLAAAEQPSSLFVGALMTGVGMLSLNPQLDTLTPTQELEYDGVSTAVDCALTAAQEGIDPLADAGCVLSVGATLAETTADIASALQSDPPDPNYRTVFVPKPIAATAVPITTIPASLSQASWASLSALDETTMWMNALRVTANRYGTALANADAASAGLQYMAFLNYFGLYLHSAGIASTDVTQLANLLSAQKLDTQSVTSEDIENGLTFLETQGSSSAFINSFFTSLGFTSDQIQTMIEQAEANPPSPPSESPVQALQALAAAFATPGVNLVATLKSVTFDSQDDDYVVTLIVTNTGATTATNVNLAEAELNSTGTSIVVPVSIGNLSYAGFARVTVTFPASAATPGAMALLKVTEAYSGGTAGGGFRVTLPN